MNHGVETDIADERLQSWIQCSTECVTSQDAVDGTCSLYISLSWYGKLNY